MLIEQTIYRISINQEISNILIEPEVQLIQISQASQGPRGLKGDPGDSTTKPIRVVESGATVQVTEEDYTVSINKDTGSATQVIWTPAPGQVVNIKDGRGDAATNNIIISLSTGGDIDGSSTIIINANRDSVTLHSDGTDAVII